MSILAALLLTVALAAPGDIYRCPNAAGGLSYQDKPCAGSAAGNAPMVAAGDDSAASQRALQQWLDGYRTRVATRAPTAAPTRAAYRGGVSGAVSEAQLAMCSERFLDCASGNAAAMDRCIDRLPRCGSAGGAPCCPQACVSRYQGLRQGGAELATSVRLALLDPDAPACGAGGATR
jgi:hypothetical protein